MIEKIVIRNGQKIVEVRSDGGKLLFIKTPDGYEMKCPRTKQVCLIPYQEILSDCLQCLPEDAQEEIVKGLNVRAENSVTV